jgi:site-specific recombinase XerD
MSKKNGPEPFFRPSRKLWYVQYQGKQYNLGADEKAARIRCHQILGGAVPVPRGATAEPVGKLACEIIDLFLEWCQKHRSKRTASWYQTHLQSFLDSLPDAATLAVEQLKPFHVVNWCDAHDTWGANHKRGAVTAVQRAFNWAEKLGHIRKNPVRGIEKPAPKRREQVLTPEEFAGLLARVKDKAFRNVLEFCWETGCRVQEVRVIEARHVSLDRHRIELPPSESKGKKRWRIIYLTPHAKKIIEGVLAEHTSGPLFRNSNARPWDAQNFNNRFCRLQHRMGREELARRGFTHNPEAVRELAATLPQTKLLHGSVTAKTERELFREARQKLTRAAAAKMGTKYALTAIRHSFATRLLEAGVDHITVAALMGHVDATMLSRVYQHVGEKTNFLHEELMRASHGRASSEAGSA